MRDVTYVCVQTETLDFTNIKIIRSRRITSVMNFFTFKSEAAHRSKHTQMCIMVTVRVFECWECSSNGLTNIAILWTFFPSHPINSRYNNNGLVDFPCCSLCIYPLYLLVGLLADIFSHPDQCVTWCGKNAENKSE